MRVSKILLSLLVITFSSCESTEEPSGSAILGFDLLNDINGHWVGTNETSFGLYDWFAFDFRPISASHSHSIYEGGTNENIINSVFIADHDGEQQIMARNGGWLETQYRATYFVLDKAEIIKGQNYYRLVDAVGGVDRAYIEFSFSEDSIYFDAYKDNSGLLDQPILHMSFRGSNRNPHYSTTARLEFNYPQEVSEVNLTNKFENLIDPDSALFLEEADDPFPKSAHGFVNDLTINIGRNSQTENKRLLLYLSKEELIGTNGVINFQNIENTVIRTIDIRQNEVQYVATFLHPDEYYLTVFADMDNNNFPSTGDYSSISKKKTVNSQQEEMATIDISLILN